MEESSSKRTKTINAESCKKYRQKHADKYWYQDAMRKKHYRMMLKQTNTKNKKKKDRERKGANKTINSREIQSTSDAKSSTMVPTSSGFSNKAKKSRSLKKGEESLPNSPWKKRKVITTLASIFKLKIQLQKNAGRTKINSQDKIKWLDDLLERSDIFYTASSEKIT